MSNSEERESDAHPIPEATGPVQDRPLSTTAEEENGRCDIMGFLRSHLKNSKDLLNVDTSLLGAVLLNKDQLLGLLNNQCKILTSPGDFNCLASRENLLPEADNLAVGQKPCMGKL